MGEQKQPQDLQPVNQDKFNQLEQQLGDDLSNEARERLEDIQGKLDEFKQKVLSKFDDYVVGISLLPPSKHEGKEDQINVMVLIDDQDSEKMSKQELKERLTQIIGEQANAVDENIAPDVLLLTELWQMCYDGKYDILQTISMSAPVYDTGMLDAIKIAEVHKNMVLNKFEKYIVTYVLAGSLVQGRATHKSDIDVFIVIDDTDVKRMTRAELKDKLRSIIIGMGADAADATGIENKLNIQVYILTDFWDNVKEANPIIFTFLRDGVPFYDRGIFMPWKQLLQMGKIKPSPEAIDMYKSTGDKMITRAKKKMREIAMEDLFWATITPSQAAVMIYGVAPPTPKETPELLRDIFVEKENILDEEYVTIFEELLTTRKAMEHGDKQDITGEELDDLLEKTEKYLSRIKDLFEEIEDLKEKESVQETYERVITVTRDVLRLEGVDKVSDDDIIDEFNEHVVQKGLLPEKHLRMLNDMRDAKEAYDNDDLTSADVTQVKKQSRQLIKELVEHIQRKRGRELDKAKIRVKYGESYGEVLLLDDHAFITHDIDADEREVSKATVEEGRLSKLEDSTLEEMEHEIMEADLPNRTFIKEQLFEDLREIFGDDVEILID
jgi:predicted nucleotidyltransferase/uncharacterized protein (UPF0332 family)